MFNLGFAKPRFATFVKYGKVELVPPTPAEIPQAIAQATRLVQSGIAFRWTNLTVKVRVPNFESTSNEI
jgi:F-type H+-transporting ATPase subunit g